MLETQYASIDLICPNCQSQWEAPFARLVNVKTDPNGRLGALLGTMHKSHCPFCKTPRDVEVIWEYYDPDQQLLIQVRPEWEFHAGGGEDWYWARYEDLVEKYKEHEVHVDVVFGFDELIEKHLGGQAAVEEARREWDARKAAAQSEDAKNSSEKPADDEGEEQARATVEDAAPAGSNEERS